MGLAVGGRCGAGILGRGWLPAVVVGTRKREAGETHRFDRENPRAKGVSSRLAEVKIQEGESIESALRRFKRKVQQEDIIKDIKKHSFYLKPGDRRRAKQALARKRTRKKQRRESD